MDMDSSPSSPKSAPQSCPVHSDATDIAGLVNDFSRFHSRDDGDATSVPRQEGPGSPGPGSSSTPGHDSVGSELSSDDWQSRSSDEEGLSGRPSDHGRSEMVDRLMRSFCASLDSKIAVIKETRARLVIKQEQEPDSRKADVAEAKDDRAEAVRKKRGNLTRLREKRASAAAGQLQTRTAPGSATSQESRRSITALVDTLAPVPSAAQAPAPAPASPPMPSHLQAPLAPRPHPLPAPLLHLPSTGTHSLRFGVPPPPPPPPPTASAAPRPLTSSIKSRPLGVQAHADTPEGDAAATHPRGGNNTDLVHLPNDISTPETERRRARSRGHDMRDIFDTTVIHEEAITSLDSGDALTDNGGLQLRRPGAQHEATRRRVLPDHGGDSQPDGSAEPNYLVNATATSDATLGLSHGLSADPELRLDFIGYGSRPMISAGEFSLYGPQFHIPGAPLNRTTLQPTQHHVAPPAAQPQEVSEGQTVPPSMKRLSEIEESQQDAVHAVEEEADGDGRRKRTRRASSHAVVADANGNRKFACPYFKRNPKKYRKWTSCPGPGWDEVHRVKTHLYRRHTLPIQCPRCWEVFKADSQLQSHLQQDPPCAVQGNRTLQEGFTKDQEKRLRSRKKTHADMTDEDKWREIYKILFPDDDSSAIPSPYYSESDTEGSSHGLSGSSELEDYASFVRREMPTLVRRELETLFREEFQDVEERIRPRIAEIVLNLQPKLLGLYKQSQIPLSEYGPQQHQQHHAGGTTSGSEPASTPLLSQGTDPATGTDSDSTPDTAFAAVDLNFCDNGLGANWDALYPDTQTHMQAPDADTGMGLNWDYEFDKLLNPLLFMPVPEQMQHEFHSGPTPAA